MNQVVKPPHESIPPTLLARACLLPWSGYLVVSVSIAMLCLGLSGLQVFPSLRWMSIFETLAQACIAIMAALFPITLLAWLIGKVSGYPTRLRPDLRYRQKCGPVVGFALFLFMVPISAAGLVQESQQIATIDAQPWQRIQLGDNRVTIDLPGGYEPIDGVVNAANGVAYGNASGDLTVLAIAIPMVDVATTSLEEYAALTVEHYLKNIKDSKLTDRFSGKTNGFESLRYRLAYESDGKIYHEQINFHRVSEQFVELRLVAPPSRFIDYSEDIAGILLSIKRMSDE